MNWLALDIGGANIKLANGDEFAQIEPFPLWQSPELLTDKLLSILSNRTEKNLAVTMTGELADCFATRCDGVQQILSAVEVLAEKCNLQNLVVYSLDGEFLTIDQARKKPLRVAAANWHALASYAASVTNLNDSKLGLLVDLGSTTCDVIPFQGQRLIHSAETDNQRMMVNELVYTGVQRTPVYAISGTIPYRRQLCPLASEWFATSWDVYLQLGDLPEEQSSCNTADNRPATKEHAKNRLARSICVEAEDFSENDAMKIAQFLKHTQASRIAAPILNVVRRLPTPPGKIVTSGIGEFLIKEALGKNEIQAELISLNELLGTNLSTCATSHALAYIAGSFFNEI